jgi:hypothetical protein
MYNFYYIMFKFMHMLNLEKRIKISKNKSYAKFFQLLRNFRE